MSRYLVYARNRAESIEQSRFLPPRVEVCSCCSPRAPSRNLMCATILDIMLTSCAYVLSLRRARSPPGPPHAAWDRACAAAGPSTFWRVASQWVSLRARGRQLLISFTSYDADQRMQESELNRSRNRAFLNLVGPHVDPEALLEVSSFPPDDLLNIMIDLHLWNIQSK